MYGRISNLFVRIVRAKQYVTPTNMFVGSVAVITHKYIYDEAAKCNRHIK